MAKRTTRKTSARSSSRSTRKSTPLKTKSTFSSRQVTFFAVIFALIAGFAAWRIFAASSPQLTLEAEQMVVPATGAAIQSDPFATPALGSNNLVRLSADNAQLGATIYTTSDISSFDVRAHTGACDSSSAYMTLMVDGQKVMNKTTVTGTSWNTYSASASFKGKTSHILRLIFNVNPASSCYSKGYSNSNLLVDNITINGPGTSEPSVRIGAIPTVVASGTATTIQWGSSNTTGACAAGGSWSGGKNQNGTYATAALTGPSSGYGAYLYKLTCSGPHGTAFGATTVNVVPGGYLSSLANLPSATTLSIDPADAAISVNGQSVPNYTPTSISGTSATLWARISPNGTNTWFYFQYHKCKGALPPPTQGGSTNTGGCTLTDNSAWLQYPANPSPVGSGKAGVDVNTPYLSGLSPSTAYIYRVVAVNAAGLTTSDTGYMNPATVTTTGTQSFYTAPR